MPLFEKSKSKDDYDDDEPKKRKVKVRIKKKKKSGDSYDGDESMYDDPMKKSSKVKKLKNRIKKKGKGDDDTYTSKESKRSKKTPTKKRTPSYDDDGEFQLDNAPPRGMMSRKAKAQPAANDDKKFRIKPYHAFPAPFYLNEAELYDCMMAPSDTVEFLTSYLTPSTKTTRRAKVPPVIMRNFGSPREDGRIGSLKVEVLGCVGLARAKPEISVYLVVGDCAFTTDIIQGARSPMWPNSSKRAAVFPLHHAYARLFVGVFDVRQRKSSEADTFCGRIAVDIPPLRPDTEYDVTFPLRHSSFIYDRTPRGVVRLRFSLHWFSERAVLMSYLKRPKNPLAFSKQAKKQPTIPCGDPKTFRNVAVTVHGVDFPGKYTRPSFRATMREFNLYQQNIRFLFKVTILDCILYENPIMSLYLFLASMHCVWLNSVRYVPPYFIGWLIYMMFESYMAYVVSPVGNLGYKPLTITEIAKGAIRDGRDKKFNFQPITVQKRARKQGKESKEPDIELQNHREFPFSERFEYLKWTAAEGIAPSPAAKNKKGGGKGKPHKNITERRCHEMNPVELDSELNQSSLFFAIQGVRILEPLVVFPFTFNPSATRKMTRVKVSLILKLKATKKSNTKKELTEMTDTVIWIVTKTTMRTRRRNEVLKPASLSLVKQVPQDEFVLDRPNSVPNPEERCLLKCICQESNICCTRHQRISLSSTSSFLLPISKPFWERTQTRKLHPLMLFPPKKNRTLMILTNFWDSVCVLPTLF
jgi:hypothetical protein